MARLLYPKPKERYARFRLNPYSPLYRYATVLDLSAGWPGDIAINGSAWTSYTGLWGAFGNKADYAWSDVLSRPVYDLLAAGKSVNYPYVAGQGPHVAAFSLAMWIRLPTAQTVQTIFDSRSGHAAGFVCFTGTYIPRFNFDLNGYEYRNQYGPILTDDRWHHIAFSYDRAVARYYCDGVLEATVNVGECGDLDKGQPNRFGGHVNTSGSTLQGFACDLCLWNGMVIDASLVAALADPGNVDLRVANGPPLLLPVRTYWPGLAMEEAADVITLPTMHLTV